MLRFYIFCTLIASLFSCVNKKLNNKFEGVNKNEIIVQNIVISYLVLDRDDATANIILTSSVAIPEINLIALKISSEEKLQVFLLFDSYNSYIQYFSGLKENSSDQGYLGKYDKGEFIPPLKNVKP